MRIVSERCPSTTTGKRHGNSSVIIQYGPRDALGNRVRRPARFPISFDGLLTSGGAAVLPCAQVDTSVCCASPSSSVPSLGRLLAMPQSPAVPTGAACLPVVGASASTFGADEQNQVHADGMR